MIVNERIVSYIHSLEKSNGPLLDEMEAYAKLNRVPIIRKEVESFLKVLIAIRQPERVLELGTAIGYSAILMSECLKSTGKITTIENYDKRIPIAQDNIKKAGKESQIQLIFGDALDEMKKMPQESFDFVFMDAAKAQYIYFLPEVVRLMKPGAVLVSDNVLQEGDLIESRFAVTRRDRTIHSRMREYMYEVKNRDDLETTIVPMGDGLTVSVKR
ncbi:MAG: O-methyltransferase [Lachnospiraceae bacterium]|nr:O-methyltransferase [Lachnospiraceae bacterium]